MVFLPTVAASAPSQRWENWWRDNKAAQKGLTACWLLALQLFTGCQSSISSDSSPPASVPKQESVYPAQSHIEMTVRDIAIEMQKHCKAASDGYGKIKTKIDAAILHGDSDEANYKIKKLLPELKAVQQEIERCREMAHGIHEKVIGKEPAK